MIEVESISGLLSGNYAEFETDTLLVGAGDHDDVMIIDEGISEAHAILRLKRTLFGTFLAIEANGGELYIDGVEVAVGEISKENRLPVTLTIGETNLALRVPPSPQSSAPGPALWLAGCCATATVLLGMSWWMISDNGSQKISAVIARGLPGADTKTAPSDAAVEEALGTAHARLTKVGLTPFLEGSVTGSGTLTVTGILPGRLVPEWQRFQHWYDSHPDMPVLVRKVSIAGGLSGLPPVSLIRLRAPRQVVFADGTEIVVGDTVLDEWTLEAIDEETMTLKRRSERITITY
ncbi:hypothetical protein [Sulfitobacter sp. 20_GPM-1509m]|uniref:hypothetical protein n=1 Tax=Sulfitobacter sp. 20_GPM-1509m TaxID=1380367 RepID=UPI0012DCA003|nr:hypothetical protein [Sulfitobacter sp. 20_GPM-1509m]